jgi:hypothetical protein
VGVVAAIVPDGDIKLALPGSTAKVKSITSLHGPAPASFKVWSHHCAAPLAKAVVGVTEHVPVPEAHPASAAVYQALTFSDVLLSFTHS